MRESALVLYRDELVSVSRGQPASVEFNFEEVWRFKKQFAQEFDPGKLYWVHVHPSGFGTRPSSTDVLCAMALHAAFGKVEYFGIICFENSGFKDIRGLISWYQFREGAFEKIHDIDLRHDPHLIEEEVYMLKALSYGELWSSESTVSVRSVQTSSSS
jgi:hypothetical protein